MRISKKYLLVIIVLMAGLVFLNFFPGLAKNTSNIVFKVFSPVENFFIRLGDRVVGFFDLIISIKDLGRENIQLKQKNLELEAEITKLKEVERENQILRDGLKISEENQLNLEMAKVVGKDIQGPREWILVDRGINQGIRKDMAVISKEFALVGRIAETMSDFSKVILITNNESIVAALIENERSQGLVKEEEKGKLFMDFIPRNEKLEKGERVITSGMDKIFSKGILIGKIESIDFSQNQLFQKIIITPAADFVKLEEIFIIK
jgi:rod shape-determining protein MreC